MQNVIEPSVESLLFELKRRAAKELATTESAYEELVDELIAEKLEWGELADDDDIQELREDLVGRWADVLKYVEKGETETP